MRQRPTRLNPNALFVRAAGAGGPLVMLHGLASSSRYWEDMHPLADEYRVLAPDLLGFGRSPKPRDGRYDPEEHVDALHRALRPRLSEPAHLIGHSLGSVVALHYAVSHPADVRSVVLISLPVIGSCALGHRTDGRMHLMHRLCVHSRPGDALFSAGMRAVAPLWFRVGPRVRRGVPPDANRDALAATWRSYWRSLEAVVYGTDIPSLLTRLHVPVLLVHGPNDFIAPIAPVRALAATSRRPLVEIPAAGHNPYYTQRAPTVRAVRSFFHEVERRIDSTTTVSLLASGD